MSGKHRCTEPHFSAEPLLTRYASTLQHERYWQSRRRSIHQRIFFGVQERGDRARWRRHFSEASSLDLQRGDRPGDSIDLLVARRGAEMDALGTIGHHAKVVDWHRIRHRCRSHTEEVSFHEGFQDLAGDRVGLDKASIAR